MGHARNVKLLRKQIRNVAQEHYQNALTAESIQELDKRFTDHAGKRLDTIAENVTKEIRKIDGQSREFRRLMMLDAGGQISRELFDINVTMLSWQKVLLEHLGIADVDAFEAKVAEKKKEISAKLEAEATAEQERRAAEEAAAAAEAKAKADAEKAVAGAFSKVADELDGKSSPQTPESDAAPTANQESQGSDAGAESASESPSTAE